MSVQVRSLTLPEVEEKHWPAQGEWTYEDYLRLPDDGRRYEIIEGVLYVANAPGYDHQFIAFAIGRLVGNHAVETGLGIVLMAPFEVHLPGIARPVQPDLLFIAAEHRPEPGTQIFEGAPDLVVEVLSPSSIRLDQHVKFGAYERAGVREYWIADPKTRSVTVHMLPAGGQEYVLVGQFGPGETLTSELLIGLTLPVDDLFPPR